MRLTHLSLTNFRNFSRLDIDLPGGPILLIGGNAQGKTSLLEAVYYLATLTSFHAATDRQLINFFSGREPLAVARILAEFSCTSPENSEQSSSDPYASGIHHLEVRLIQESGNYSQQSTLRKEFLLDGIKRKANGVIGAFNAVLFLPQMLRVVEDGPEERRRFLNLVISQVDPLYHQAMSEYTTLLSQRNALLKQLSERGGDADQLTFWDEQLSARAGQIIYTRIHAIQELERIANQIHRELTRNQELLRLIYQPSYEPLPQPTDQYALPLESIFDRSGLSLSAIQSGYLECLSRLRREEITRGITTLGPHRDDFRFLSNGMDLGHYGSRGQARTAMLSMKLAEVAWIKDRTNQCPILLLDEVLAELDLERRTDLLGRLLKTEQALLTTTDLDLFSSGFVENAKVWHIHGGRVEI